MPRLLYRKAECPGLQRSFKGLLKNPTPSVPGQSIAPTWRFACAETLVVAAG